MWQFEQAVRGIADACVTLGLPVTGGNVSFYNSTGEQAIHPTPVIGVLGVLQQAVAAVPASWRDGGQALVLLGTTTAELSGSSWAEAVHHHLGGRPPVLDLAHERRLAALLRTTADRLGSAHDLSDGGLFAALAEASLRHRVGASVDIGGVADGDTFAALLSESAGRVLVSLPMESVAGLLEAAATAQVPATRIGMTGGPNLEVAGPDVALDFSLVELGEVWREPLRRAFA
jgi:phosphoribosylformylglycinamidine synthase